MDDQLTVSDTAPSGDRQDIDESWQMDDRQWTVGNCNGRDEIPTPLDSLRVYRKHQPPGRQKDSVHTGTKGFVTYQGRYSYCR